MTADPRDAFFLIVADIDTGMFCVEGPMSDDAPWHVPVRPDRSGPRRAGARVSANPQVRRRSIRNPNTRRAYARACSRFSSAGAKIAA
jgi:hypothetical protein